jgi:hypothetical protein
MFPSEIETNRQAWAHNLSKQLFEEFFYSPDFDHTGKWDVEILIRVQG